MSLRFIRPLCAGLRLRSVQIVHRNPAPLVCTCQTKLYSQQTQVDSMNVHDKRLYDFFRAYDLNGDGEITREELFRAMKRAIGYNDRATDQIVDAIYVDCEKEKNAKITFEDFRKGIKIVPVKR